ncbi:thiazolylpeptide-type bacteriocin [Kitasatospora sp. NPDC008050]|uniref:thiazolylpeptide-type bacteriocin n=1 Tax=Kitasatospora sp. NPDC008050 TaxID=3364021 RepID=UPI0036EFB2B4
MSDTTTQPSFDLQDFDLDLSSLTVTSLRDTAALPETGASQGACSCESSSSCAIIPPVVSQPPAAS